MYFAVLWKNKELSMKELEYVNPKNLHVSANQQIVLFDEADEDKLSVLAWLVKWWKIIDWELSDFFVNAEKRILWVSDKQQGIKMKKQFWLKRFKQVDLFHTDLEVKNKWIELIKIGSKWWEVLWYQNIKLYEVVDFEKPWRSMQMWMMPAKLTHTLINIWLSIDKDQTLIYDPFVWSWTTGFLANYFWYDFLWSDLKLTFADKNYSWWKDWKWASPNKEFKFFVHDATKDYEDMSIFNSKTPPEGVDAISPLKVVKLAEESPKTSFELSWEIVSLLKSYALTTLTLNNINTVKIIRYLFFTFSPPFTID